MGPSSLDRNRRNLPPPHPLSRRRPLNRLKLALELHPSGNIALLRGRAVRQSRAKSLLHLVSDT